MTDKRIPHEKMSLTEDLNKGLLISYPDKLQGMKFNKVWIFPLVRRGNKVYDSNDIEVFDFCGSWKKKDEWKIDDKSKDRLIGVINGTDVVKNNQVLTYKMGEVFMELKGVVRRLFVMRGFGYMTCESGLNMNHDEVLEIYNEFSQFVVELVDVDYSVK